SLRGRHRAGGDKVNGMTTPVADRPAPAREPRRPRFVASLLYGRNVDRAAKTRARIGLAVLVFALGYAVIAGRLVMFATAPEGHGARRTIGPDAGGTGGAGMVG